MINVFDEIIFRTKITKLLIRNRNCTKKKVKTRILYGLYCKASRKLKRTIAENALDMPVLKQLSPGKAMQADRIG